MNTGSNQTPRLRKHSTLHDVARECAVSAMTVSRVLGSREGVGEQTRRRVLEVARRMNYQPSSLAINFARSRSGFIGVATNFEGLLGSYYLREAMAGFQKALRNTGNDFALFDTMSEAFEKPEELAKLYGQRKADGLLIVAPHKDDLYLRTLSDLGVAFIVVGERVDDRSVPSISCDEKQGIELICAHLLEMGHRDIAYIAGPGNLGSARSRQQAFIDCMRRAQVDIPRQFVQRGTYQLDAGKAATLRLLSGKHRRPTAIIGGNDLSALGVIEVLREHGLRVPEDVSVCGFDDMLPATESSAALTTVRQPVRDIGERAARILLESIETGQLPSGHVDVPVTLVIRGSSGPVPTHRDIA